MPEGPELCLASRFVNRMCSGRLFGGKIVKSEVAKSEDVNFLASSYEISATSRGKEMKLLLTKVNDSGESKLKHNKKDSVKGAASESGGNRLQILFRFGMSGKFEFAEERNMHKHSHLRFFTRDDKPAMVLSYVDPRRFGRWQAAADWSLQRSPDPMFEYPDFRKNILSNLDDKAFDRPICETLLDQKFFNGVGNYLRAEILHRADIAPFACARQILANLAEDPPDVKPAATGDFLHLCHTIPLEVVSIGNIGYDPTDQVSYQAFNSWLKCYMQPNMKNIVDKNGRTVWFSGEAGPLAPKGGKSRKGKIRGKEKSSDDFATDVAEKQMEGKEEEEKGNASKRIRREINRKERSSRSTIKGNKEENARKRSRRESASIKTRETVGKKNPIKDGRKGAKEVNVSRRGREKISKVIQNSSEGIIEGITNEMVKRENSGKKSKRNSKISNTIPLNNLRRSERNANVEDIKSKYFSNNDDKN